MRIYYSLYGRLLSLPVLIDAFKQVKRNRGAPGIDGQSLVDFEANLEVELSCLLDELKDKRYQVQPVRRFTLPKPGGGERLIGIPTVRDRIVQQALKGILEPLFEPDFHPSSYGYRPGRSAHQAISKAQLFIRTYHRQWVVDMDVSKCFDTLNHDLIIGQFRERISDGSILSLLRQCLESGVMIGGIHHDTDVGSPQGGVISPLISNVYLNQFDQYMKARGHRIVRYADDILILCQSETAARNAQQVATAYLEEDLKLKVNHEKTHLTHSDDGVAFLGVEVFTTYTRIQKQKVVAFKAKVKSLTRRNQGQNLPAVIGGLNPVLRGFVNYFRIANCKTELRKLMMWVRRRLRGIQLTLWKKPRRLHRRLRQLGYQPPFRFIRMRSWRNAGSPLAHYAMPNAWFHGEWKLVDMAGIDVGISVPVPGR